MSSFYVFSVNKIRIVAVLCVMFAVVFLCVNFIPSKKTLPNCLYFVCVENLLTSTQASVVQEEMERKGASGKILTQANQFNVLLFLYLNKKDANAVVQQLDLFDLALKVNVFKISKLDNKTRRIVNKLNLKGVMQFFCDTFFELFDLVFAFDKSNVSESQIAYSLQKISKTAVKLRLDLNDSNFLEKIGYEFCVQFEDVINDVLQEKHNANELSSKLKTLCFECVFAYNDCVNNVNSAVKNA